MQFSWVVAAGWSNPHRPRVERITIIRRVGRTNAHRPRIHPRKLCLRGARCGGGGCRAKRDGGWVLSSEASAKNETRVTSNPPCHCEGVRSTLKTLSYDCGNPVQYVCGQTPAVLFYLLDRHAPLAMTKGTKWIIPHHSYHSRARGPHKHIRVCGVDKA